MPSPLHLRTLLLLLALLPLAACDSPGGPDEDDGELDIGWLEENAVPLRSTSPGADFPDLPALGAMVGNARIVGLGEATHGTREFFTMKHRVLRYLVEEKGFTTFGIEATYAEATRVNRYVLTGEGDPAVLLSNLYFWTWNTAEVLEMIQWMRAYNADPAHARKVTFWGFDMQFSRVAMNDVVAYLRGVDAAAADSAVSWYGCYRVFQDSIGRPSPNYAALGADQRAVCRAGVRSVDSLMAARAAAFSAATGAPAYQVARRAARVVVQNEDMRGGTSGGAARDRYMAENAAWLAETVDPDGKLVLWAHNAHVSRAPQWMGQHLGQQFGNDYRVVGFSFYQGELNAVMPGTGLRSMTAPPATPSSYELEFHRLGLPGFIVDLRPLRAGAPNGAEWLRGPRPFRMIGAVYATIDDLQYYRPTALPADYDVLIHVESTSATVLLPFRYQ